MDKPLSSDDRDRLQAMAHDAVAGSIGEVDIA